MSWSKDWTTPPSRNVSVCSAVKTFVTEPIRNPVFSSGVPEDEQTDGIILIFVKLVLMQ